MNYVNCIWEDFKGWSQFDYAWLLIACSIMFATTIFDSYSMIGIVSMMTNVICVILVSKGKFSNYYWGIVGVITYAYVAYTFKLYGDMQLNLFIYFPLQFIGMYLWAKSSKENINELTPVVKPKYLSNLQIVILGFLLTTAIYFYSMYLVSIGASAPLLDAITNVLSVSAMILMVYRYAEQWLLWIVVNIISIVIWSNFVFVDGSSEAIPALIQWIVFLINSVIGTFNWYYKNNNKIQDEAKSSQV